MARKSNPSLSSLLPLLLLGGAGIYFLSKSGSTPSGGTPVAPIAPDGGGNLNANLVVQIQTALNNLLLSISTNPAYQGIPEPFTGQFDQPTADAYVRAGNIVYAAMQAAPATREVLPTGTFTPDLTIAITNPSDPSVTTQKASKAFLAWLIMYYYSAPPAVPRAFVTFKSYALQNFSMHPDEKALYDASKTLYA